MVSAVMGSQGVPALENFLAKVARKRGQPGDEDETGQLMVREQDLEDPELNWDIVKQIY